MSSYYDEMAKRVARALERDGQEAAEQVVAQVKDRVRRYLDYAEAHVWKRDLPALVMFKVNTLRLLEGPNSEPGLGPAWVIQEIHSIGHDLGHKFRLTRCPLRYTSDNPYWPGHWGITEGLEYTFSDEERRQR